MIKKTNKGALVKPVVDHTLDELWELTRLTYSPSKKILIEKNSTTSLKNKKLSEYIERLEYELKVIDAM